MYAMQREKTFRTPWGASQYQKEIAPGVVFHGTAGHGGLKVDRKLTARIPDYLREPGGWYEEDLAWAKVFCVFPHLAKDEKEKEEAKRTLANWFPDEYERFYGFTLQPGESYKKDEKAFKAMTIEKGLYVSTSAFGDWHEEVPEGMVGVCATVGGVWEQGAPKGWFLVPGDEYKDRTNFGFIIDPERHPAWPTKMAGGNW